MEESHARSARSAVQIIDRICTPPNRDGPEPTNLFRRHLAPLALVDVDPACFQVERFADYEVLRCRVDAALLDIAEQLEMHRREFVVQNGLDAKKARRYVADLGNTLRFLKEVTAPGNSAVDRRLP